MGLVFNAQLQPNSKNKTIMIGTTSLFVFLAACVVIQCQEPCITGTCQIDGISHVRAVGTFQNSWHDLNEREMFGTTCETMIRGSFHQSKWRWQGRFRCPSLSTIEGYSKSLESRDDVIEHAIDDYMQKGKQHGFLTNSQLQNASNVPSESIDSLDQVKTRYVRDITYKIKRENQTKTYGNGLYYGDTVDGVEHGVGGFLWNSGAKYIGGWSNGNMHGIGIYYFVSGNRYVGQFQNNELHGYGIMTTLDGYVYKGDFISNKKSGYGEETWADGDKYIGQFKNNLRHGFGYWFFASGKRRAAFYVDGTEA